MGSTLVATVVSDDGYDTKHCLEGSLPIVGLGNEIRLVHAFLLRKNTKIKMAAALAARECDLSTQTSSCSTERQRRGKLALKTAAAMQEIWQDTKENLKRCSRFHIVLILFHF